MEFLKKIEDVERTVVQRFNRLIIETSIHAKGIVRRMAHDTGDMENAISYSMEYSDGMLKGQVFVDPTKLYNKRKHYERSSHIYPIYVHNGVPAHTKVKYHSWAKATKGQIKYYAKDTPYGQVKSGVKVKARRPIPFLRMAWVAIKNFDRYKNFAKDIIVIHGETK